MTFEEFTKAFMANGRYSGDGLNTTVHTPCPFCAAPDFMVHRLLDTIAALQAGAVCKRCGRGIRCDVSQDPGETAMTVYQTVGEDPPPWAPFPRLS